jgi:DNA-binding transcriptional LysR family regulator
MNLKKFAHFLAVIDMKSFSKAAEAVHLSPPALSRSLQTLEDELGIPLFDRRNGIIAPSGYSAPIVAKVRRLLSDARAVEESIERIKGLEEGEIRIGFGPYAAAASLNAVICKVIQEYPNLKIHINLSNPGVLLDLMKQDRLDLVIADDRYVTKRDNVDVKPLPVQQVAFVASLHNQLVSRKGRINLSELKGHSIGVPEIPESVMQIFRRAGIEDFPKVVCDDMRVLLELAKETPLIVIVPKLVADDFLTKGDLVSLPIDLSEEHYALPCIITPAGRVLGPASKLLINLICEWFDNHGAEKLA